MDLFVYNIIYFLSIVLAVGLLFFLLRRKSQSKIVKELVWLNFGAIVWFAVDFLTLAEKFSNEVHIIIWKLGFVLSFSLVVLLLRFIVIFTQTNILNWKKYTGLLIYFVLVFFTLFTDQVIAGVRPLLFAGDSNYVIGEYFVVMAVVMSIALFLSFYYILKKLVSIQDQTQKIKFRRLAIALAVLFIFVFITNLAFPMFGIPIPRLAALGIIFLLIFFTYSIFKSDTFGMNFRGFKIRTKIILPIILTAIIVLSAASAYSYFFTVKILKQEAISHLETTAQLVHRHIENILSNKKEKLEIAATHSDLSQEELQTILNINEGFYELFVLDSNGIIISSSDISHIGLDQSNDDYFVNGKNASYIKPAYFSDTSKKESIAIATPHAGGVLVARVGLEFFNSIVSDRTGLGETGEILLAYKDKNGDAVFFTERKFEEVKKEEDSKDFQTLPMDEALLKKEKVFLSLHDYRHVGVISVTRYIDEVEIGIVVKIDEQEAFAPATGLLNFFIIRFFIVLFLFFIITYIISGKISKPIILLQKGIGIIKKGNLDHKVGTQKKDEVGELSRAFDEMTTSIKQSQLEVETKVQEQTKEISKNAQNLANQQKAILNILEDVEEEKIKVSHERDKIDAILYSIGDAVFVVNKNLRITMINQIAVDMAACSIDQCINQSYYEHLKFVHEKDGKLNDKFIKDAIKTGEVQEMANHTLLISSDGKKTPVADSAAPLKDKDGKVIGCVVVFRDVTHERQIDQAKTEFVSLASHQLRTPLSTINWYAEMLLAGDAGKITEDQKKYLDEIYKGNQRMVGLVNALLNVSRLELGTFTIEPEMANIIDIAKSVLNEQKQNIKKKQLVINETYDVTLPKMSIDTKLTRIIFQNLISNAVKYTPEKGKISIKIEKLNEDVLIQVADTGMGIPKLQQKKIFEKLFRADNVRETDTEGTGLGLYIIKSILDNTGGKVWFESVEKKGTSFSATIPLSGMQSKKGTKELS